MNLRPLLGDTLADLYALLQRDADQLALLGVSINSIDRLFEFELRKANDLPAVPVPAAAVDLSFPAPGLPLVFARGLRRLDCPALSPRTARARLGR